jgi:hypothetical protein
MLKRKVFPLFSLEKVFVVFFPLLGGLKKSFMIGWKGGKIGSLKGEI